MRRRSSSSTFDNDHTFSTRWGSQGPCVFFQSVPFLRRVRTLRIGWEIQMRKGICHAAENKAVVLHEAMAFAAANQPCQMSLAGLCVQARRIHTGQQMASLLLRSLSPRARPSKHRARQSGDPAVKPTKQTPPAAKRHDTIEVHGDDEFKGQKWQCKAAHDPHWSHGAWRVNHDGKMGTNEARWTGRKWVQAPI